MSTFHPNSCPSPSSGPGGWDSEDDVDVDDEDSVTAALGCLGPLGGLLAPELQRYQKHLRDQRVEQESFAEVSPGAVGGSAKAEHQAAINSMMMERMSTDITALKKQYTRIKRRQQQQAMQFYIRTGKCPATRVLASQLNQSSSVINHLLLDRKQAGPSRTCRPVSASTPPLTGSPSRRCCSSLLSRSSRSPGSSRGSPWRAHVRQHRKNMVRARAQLGFGDSEEREDEEEGGFAQSREDEGEIPSPAGHSGCEAAPQPAEETEEVKVEEVVVQLDSLDLEMGTGTDPEQEPESNESKPAALIPPSPPPSSNGHLDSGSEAHCAPASPPRPPSSRHSLPPAQPSSSSSSSQPALTTHGPPSPSSSLSFIPAPGSASCLPSSSSPPPPVSSPSSSSSSLCAPAQHIFSPFPSIKQPRKSVAARNLGLYGPTSRTPTVHFPQLSRSMNRSSAVGVTGRR